MSSQITPQGDIGYIDGLLVFPGDLLNDNISQLNADGEVLASMLGGYDALPMINPVTMTATVGGGHVNVTVGTLGQWLICQGRMCDYIPLTTLTQSPPDGVTSRVDILCVQYTQTGTDGVTRVFQQPDGSDSTTTILTERQSVTWDYVQGTPGAGQPATPGGFELFAVIAVPAGAVTLTPVIQFKTTQQLGFSLNALLGAVTLVGGTDISVGVSGQNITIAVNVAIVNTVNGHSGAITVVAGSGINVSTSGGGAITITNTQTATTVNGIAGAVTIAAGTGITVGTAGSTITITSTGVTDVMGISGSVTIAGAGGTTIGVAGSTITITSTTGVNTLNGLSGALSLTSTGGTISIAASGSTIDLEVVPSGTTGGTGTPAAQAGIVMVSKWMNIGTSVATPLPISDDHFLIYPTLLGGGWFALAGNPGTGVTLEMHVHLQVKSGAGAQVIGGNFVTNSRQTFLSLDGSNFFSSGLVVLSQAWSVSVPDDGAVHILIAHVTLPNGVSGDMNLDMSTFLPQAASGGVDSSKFVLAGPGF